MAEVCTTSGASQRRFGELVAIRIQKAKIKRQKGKGQKSKGQHTDFVELLTIESPASHFCLLIFISSISFPPRAMRAPQVKHGQPLLQSCPANHAAKECAKLDWDQSSTQLAPGRNAAR